MRIFFTGGTGFFGKAILRQAFSGFISNISSIESMVILSRNPQKFLKENPEFKGKSWLKFHQGDILQPSSLPIGDEFTHVLHAATESTAGPKLCPLERFNQITEGTRNLLDYAYQQGIKKFLLTSSGGVYGPQPLNMGAIPESWNGIPDPMEVNNSYSIGKRFAEHLCAIYADKYGLDVVIARCFAFVGKDLPLDAHFAIGNFIRDAIYSSEIIVNGDGSQIRTYLDQRDLAEWLMVILDKGVPGSAYNVGSDEAISILELANLIRGMTFPNKSIIIKNDKKNQNDRKRYVPDIFKVKSQFGLSPTFLLRESIQEIINDHLK